MLRSTISESMRELGRTAVLPNAVERVIMRRTVLLLTVLLAMLVLASGVAIAATLRGTAGNDQITGTTLNDTIYGLGGNDTLLGSSLSYDASGNDTIYGGLGDDGISGRMGADSIAGESGNDYLADGPIKDVSKDRLSGGYGNDTIVSDNYPRTNDVISCGSGFDQVTADSADTFLDRSNCEWVKIHNPTSTTDTERARPRFR
jgi:Ca2+-binding RTX toxin-like protein